MYYKITINEDVDFKRYKYNDDDDEQTMFYRLKLIS